MLTTKDWISRATDDAAAESLAHAEAAARWPDDWLGVAEAWLARGNSADARRCVTAALEDAAGDHWPTKRASELLLGKFADREGAVAALGRIAARLTREERVRAYQWVQLGRAYQDVLADAHEAKRCIDQAAAMARSAADLADLAAGYVELLDDVAAARDVLERAETTARSTGEHRELWGVANRWMSSIGDAARARDTLMIATTETADVRDLTAFATAWRSLFDDEHQVRASLVRAETIATTAKHWLEIAEAYFDGGTDNRVTAWDPDGVRRALEASLAATPSDEECATISTGYRDWLGISAADAGLSPAVRAPELALARIRTLDDWNGEQPRALLDQLRARLTPKQLEAIAKSDYGIAWTKHHKVLVEIHATGLVPIPLEWHPLEALELYRWKRGADTDHTLRAFASAVLALDAVAPSSRQCGHLGNAIAPLLESAWACGLDDECLDTTLVWLAEVARDDVVAWPLLGLVLSRARRAPDDPRLVALVAALIAAEAAQSSFGPDTGWLVRTTNFDAYHDLWRLLAVETLAELSSPHLAEVSRLLRSRPPA